MKNVSITRVVCGLGATLGIALLAAVQFKDLSHTETGAAAVDARPLSGWDRIALATGKVFSFFSVPDTPPIVAPNSGPMQPSATSGGDKGCGGGATAPLTTGDELQGRARKDLHVGSVALTAGVTMGLSEALPPSQAKAVAKVAKPGSIGESIHADGLPPAMVALAKLCMALPADSQRFIANKGQFAIVAANGVNYVITEDGRVLEFSADTSTARVRTDWGAECPLVASNDEFSIAQLAADSLLIRTADGRDIVLRTIGSLASSASEVANVDSFSALKAILPRVAAATTPQEVFASCDEQVAMSIDPASNTHTLVLPDGTAMDFLPATDDLELTTSVGTCPLVASGNGVAVGSLTMDTYVVQRQPEGEAPVIEQTLFGRSVLPPVISVQVAASPNAGVTQQTSSPHPATESNQGVDVPDAASVALTPTSGSSDQDVADAADVMLAQTGEDGPAVADTNTPEWAMSMSERRVYRREVSLRSL